jgi:hypothetical protein
MNIDEFDEPIIYGLYIQQFMVLLISINIGELTIIGIITIEH